MDDTSSHLEPLPLRPWSRRLWLAVIATALFVWLLYARIGPGLDYYGCYTWMVTLPDKLSQVPYVPWTQNPTWLIPFMAPFVSMPGRAGYILFMGASVIMMVYGSHFFGGKAILVLLSAQMWWIFWWGQIEGWAVLALVVGWLALKKHSWPLMFLALAMGSFKPHIGFIPLIALWWWSGRQRWYSLAAMVLLTAASVAIWGPWPLWYAQEITNFVGDNHAGPWNASLGWIALPLFIPALFLPLTRYQRVMALTATGLLVSPYMPYYSTIILLVFNIPWWAYLFAFSSYFPNLIGTRLAWNAVALLPLSVLAWLYWPFVIRYIASRKRKTQLEST